MVETIRKIGIITKGIIYSLAGLLTFLAAVNLGGEVSGKNGVISFLEDQTFGKIIVMLIAAGLIMYAIWRFCSAFLDSKEEGSDKKGILKRIGYAISGLIYGGLAYSILNNSLSSGGTKTSATQLLLDNEGGEYLLYGIGLILWAVGFYQFYKGYSGKFLDDIQQSGKIESEELLRKTGTYGFIARGIAFILFAFFVYLAASEKNAEAIKGLEGMFNFLQGFSYGNILMGLMSIGLLCYGVYQYFLARYSSLY
jgi:hypothetical protein